MKQKDPSIGLVGLGYWGKNLARNLNDLGVLSAICDKNEEFLEKYKNIYSISQCYTNFDLLLQSDIDAIVIATPAITHGSLVRQSLNAGKHVFVEKPLALSWDELEKIKDFYGANDNVKLPLLMTGFNRRFSPYMKRIKEVIKNRNTPLIVNYQMNTKYLEENHWQRTDEGGGRNLAEACHIYDLFTFLCETELDHVSASSIRSPNNNFGKNENFSVHLRFKDGSLCNLTYTSLGSTTYPKEICHLFFDQTVFYLNDYTSLDVFGPIEDHFETNFQDKGHFEEMKCFLIVPILIAYP